MISQFLLKNTTNMYIGYAQPYSHSIYGMSIQQEHQFPTIGNFILKLVILIMQQNDELDEFDDFLQLPTTVGGRKDRIAERHTVITVSPDYDDKDKELEESDQEIYDKAITAFEDIRDSLSNVEPKYRARLLEVAVQYLNTAISATHAKRQHKVHKDKLKSKIPAAIDMTPGTVVLKDRNAVLKEYMQNPTEAEIVDETK